MFAFFGRSRAARKRRERTQPRRHRPLLEPLEDRTLLATVGFAVNTGDSGGGTAVATDGAGNVYTAAVALPGSYTFIPLFYADGHVGEYQVSTGEAEILAKYSSSGQLLWSSVPDLWFAYAYFDASGFVV